MTRFYLFSLLLVLSGTSLVAQSAADGRDCDSEGHQEILMTDPDYATAYQQRHARMKALLAQRGGERAMNCTEVIRLPMAFHFQGISNPDAACLRALAENQLQILNDDYQGVNADIDLWSGPNGSSQFYPGASNGESCIQFCLPTTDHPAGYGLADGDLAVTINEFSGSFNGDWSGYINVFVRNIGALGFSPLGGTGSGDGVTVDTGAFGSGNGCSGVSPGAPFDLGRTLTHELGHYLDLPHIWGGGCGQDDGVSDTPNQSGSNFGCPGNNTSSCGSVDMHMNYMDYVNDQCMYMFSAGQIAVMDAYAVANLQNVITNPAACDGVGGGGGPVVRTVEFGTPETILDEGTVGCAGGDVAEVMVPLTISGAPDEDVTVTITFTGTAEQGTDYTVSNSTVVFPAGATAQQFITLQIIEDGDAEDDEFIQLDFAVSAAGGGAEAGAQNFATVSLLNDDAALTPNAAIQTRANGDDGFTFVDFGPFAEVDFFDENTGAVMLTLINQSGHDFGCTQVQVDRGSDDNPGATMSPSPQAAFLSDKTFFISPENNSFTDAYRVRLYYTAAEVAGFLDDADQPLWNIGVFNSGNFIGQSTQLIEADPVVEDFGGNTYFEATFTDGLSGLAIGVASATLPVDLTTFTAAATEKTIVLDWATAREENNQGFTVERRVGRSGNFLPLGFVAASGTPQGANYTLTDRTAVAGQTYFYRLQQRDLNGTQTASDIVAATLAGHVGRVTAFPNPAGDELRVSVATAAAGILHLTATDGRLLRTRTFAGGGASLHLDLTDIPPGVYLLTARTETETIVRKVVHR